MCPGLADHLTDDRLSVAERSALVLDRELYPLGGGYVLPDAIDGLALRAGLVAVSASDRRVAELDTAAWVWGARAVPPAQVELASPIGLAPRLSAVAAGHTREVRLAESDVTRIGSLWITTRARTALDLLRYRDELSYRPEIVRDLVTPSGFAELDRMLNARTRLPHARRARARLARLRIASGLDAHDERIGSPDPAVSHR